MAALIKRSHRVVVYAIVAILMALTVMTIMPSAYAGTDFFEVNLCIWIEFTFSHTV
jgi:hypothetical protein